MQQKGYGMNFAPNIVKRRLSQLKPYGNNPRINDEAAERLVGVLEEYGYLVLIVIDAGNNIVAGEARYKALLSAAAGSDIAVDCILADSLSKEQLQQWRLIDNKAAEWSSWDMGKLEAELAAIDIDMADFGFDPALFDVEPEAFEDDFVLELPAVAKAKLGEVYKLGRHSLMCGDSTNKADIETLMGGQLVNLLQTDPPYNVDYQGSTSAKLKMENDNMGDAAYYEFMALALSNAAGVMRPGAAFYIWHADKYSDVIRRACRQAGLLLKQCLVWYKNHFALGRQDYQWQHEPCLYGWKEGAAHYFVDLRTQTTVIDDTVDIEKMPKAELKEFAQKCIDNWPLTSVIRADKPLLNDLHPTMKPLAMIGRFIQNSTHKGEVVADFFGGSGTTLIACERLCRTCYMMEFDPKYVDVIIERWEKLTSKKAELIN